MTTKKKVVDMHTSIHLTMTPGTLIALKPIRINSQRTISKAFLISIFKAYLGIRLAR
jgi:hypothetical protein